MKSKSDNIAKPQEMFQVEEPQNVMTVDQFNAKYKKKKKAGKQEERVQLQVCKYLKNKYPNVIFMCDMASGLRLPIWLGSLHKKMRSSRGLPDMFIAHPKRKYGNVDKIGQQQYEDFNGLFIELKKDGTRKKDGTIPANWKKEKVGNVIVKYDHHAEQEEVLRQLNEAGYRAEFACGFFEAMKLIDEYLG